MLHILLLDDNQDDLNTLSSFVSKYFNDLKIEISIKHFDSSLECINSLKNYDIAFLDIEMEHKTGMDVAKIIEKRYPNTFIVFVTNLIQYAVESYSVNAISYILKPLIYDDFVLKMRRVRTRLENHFHLKLVATSKEKIFVDLKQILYVTSQGHYVVYKFNDGHEIVSRNTIKNMEAELADHGFLRVSSYCIINLSLIQKIRGDEIFFDDKTSVKISRSYKNKVKKEIEEKR